MQKKVTAIGNNTYVRLFYSVLSDGKKDLSDGEKRGKENRLTLIYNLTMHVSYMEKPVTIGDRSYL